MAVLEEVVLVPAVKFVPALGRLVLVLIVLVLRELSFIFGNYFFGLLLNFLVELIVDDGHFRLVVEVETVVGFVE